MGRPHARQKVCAGQPGMAGSAQRHAAERMCLVVTSCRCLEQPGQPAAGAGRQAHSLLGVGQPLQMESRSGYSVSHKPLGSRRPQAARRARRRGGLSALSGRSATVSGLLPCAVRARPAGWHAAQTRDGKSKKRAAPWSCRRGARGLQGRGQAGVGAGVGRELVGAHR